MSNIIKPVMLDETGQVTNQKLTDVGTKIDDHKNSTATGLTTVGTKIDDHKNSTATGLSSLGSSVQNSGAATTQALNGVAGSLHTIAEAIEAVHSVNGMTGDVVIDSTNVVLNKLTDSKTIAQVLSEEQDSVNDAVNNMEENVNAAIQRLNQANIPVSFTTSAIEGDDYLLTVETSSL